MTIREPSPHQTSGVLVVGGGLAGITVARTLRDLGYTPPVTVISDEDEMPYDRPPLSKQFLTGQGAHDLEVGLLSAQEIEEAQFELLLGESATSLDPTRRELRTTRAVRHYDHLVIATGARPRRPDWAHLAGVQFLRTRDDALAIRNALTQGVTNVVIVGGGWIGLEVAASVAAHYDAAVTVIEASASPLAATVDAKVAEFIRSKHEEHGVRFLTGQSVTSVEPGGRSKLVVLTSDGTVLAADLVVVGIGVTPNVEWLDGSGLRVSNGVECDENLHTSADGVYAVGDLASSYNARFGTRMRVEHWTTAGQQAAHVAAQIAGVQSEPPQLPIFWSNQYDLQVQFAGRWSPTDDRDCVWGSLESGRALFAFGSGGQLSSALAINAAGAWTKMKRHIAAGLDWDRRHEPLARNKAAVG